MSSARLQQQFIRLWQYYEGKPQETTLQELAGLLHCTRRHMRTLLHTMQEKGWIDWNAQTGRGKRSQLTFLYTGFMLQQQRTEALLEQDKIDQLVQLIGNKETVRQMLISHLGRSFRQGRHILRVLYYRPLLNLLPGSALRRSETHIARQIFNGLIHINEENGEVEADIAHHWQQLTPLQWRFYLRPGIRFHHGRELDMADVITSLQRITTLPLYAHISHITSPTNWTLDIYLSQPDNWLPWLLGSISATILPQEWKTMPGFASQPIGTGPYSVVRNNNDQLKIHAFEDYFGFRALIDEVNFWVIPEVGEALNCGVQLEGTTESEKAVESRLEEGCYYILFDSRSPTGSQDAVRCWLSNILSPVNLLYHAGDHYQQSWFPAYGLLPRWHHTAPMSGQKKPASLKSITLTFYRDHAEHRVISNIIEKLLAQHDVRLIIQEVEYPVWHQGDVKSDIWLNSANFTLPLEYSLFAQIYEVPLIQKCINIDWTDAVQRWRSFEMTSAQWCHHLVENKNIFPLIHHWLRIEGERSMRGIRMNMLGWFDFKSTWFAPPES